MPEYILIVFFFPVISELNFQHRYSSHMIIQKSFKYSDLLLKKTFIIIIIIMLLSRCTHEGGTETRGRGYKLK